MEGRIRGGEPVRTSHGGQVSPLGRRFRRGNRRPFHGDLHQPERLAHRIQLLFDAVTFLCHGESMRPGLAGGRARGSAEEGVPGFPAS